jgi:multiple sugar transport system permease protein
VDGATPGQLFWHIFLPLIAPALVAIGAYAFFLSWNEYLFAFLFLAKDENLTIPVVLGHILTSDDAPWTLLMATAIIYSLPPVLLYYAFRKHMTAGLVSGGVKG